MDEARSASASRSEATKHLISARVDDTNVYDAAGRKLGQVYTFHIHAASGQVEYAVLSLGGFLGLGQSYHPVPFGLLTMNADRSGYTIAADKSLLDGAPSYRPDSAPVWDAAYARRISDYYGIPPRSGSF